MRKIEIDAKSFEIQVFGDPAWSVIPEVDEFQCWSQVILFACIFEFFRVSEAHFVTRLLLRVT